MDISAELDSGILLRNAAKYEECDRVFGDLLRKYPFNAMTHYQLSLSLRYQRKQYASLRHAREAFMNESAHLYAVHMMHQLAICNKVDEAIALAIKQRPNTWEEKEEITVAIQFAKYLRDFPIDKVKHHICKLLETKKFVSVNNVASSIKAAIDQNLPFALVRLGDGEGAWAIMDSDDESRFANLYKLARKLFLIDWFGSDDFMTDNSFLRHASDLIGKIRRCDIVGITDLDRLDHEYGLVSIRGIHSSVNVLRSMEVLDSCVEEDRIYCSNNIHYELHSIGFVDYIIKSGVPLGIITSQTELAGKIKRRGGNVRHVRLIPGDSRNFWINGGKPDVQFPRYYHENIEYLRNSDLVGTVFFVSAGFVGKSYMELIRSRGGVAIDTGALADALTREL